MFPNENPKKGRCSFIVSGTVRPLVTVATVTVSTRCPVTPARKTCEQFADAPARTCWRAASRAAREACGSWRVETAVVDAPEAFTCPVVPPTPAVCALQFWIMPPVQVCEPAFELAGLPLPGVPEP